MHDIIAAITVKHTFIDCSSEQISPVKRINGNKCKPVNKTITLMQSAES